METSGSSQETIYPIHHIIKSGCVDNLKSIKDLLVVQEPKAKNGIQSSYVNVKDSKGRNCLHLLIEMLTDQNYNEMYAMMEILLQFGCNVNSSDINGQTPLSILFSKSPPLKNWELIFNYIKSHAIIDYNVHGNLKLPDTMPMLFSNPFQMDEDFVVNKSNLIELLRSGDINKFEVKFPLLSKESEDNYKAACEEFLQIAIQFNYINIVDLIVSNATNVNDLEIMDKNAKIPLLFWAYKQANLEVFSILLMHPKIKLYYQEKTLLHHFFDKLETYSYENSEDMHDFETTNEMTSDEIKCFEFLLNSSKCKQEYLSEEYFEKKISPIFLSVKYGIDYMTRRLLENGAYIGPVITHIRRSLLSDFLDSCITSNLEFYDDEKLKLNVDYKFLMPPLKNIERTNDHTKIEMSNSSTEQMISTSSLNQNDQYISEMHALKELVSSTNLQRLIMHPVLSSFVFIKWNKIQFLLDLNFLLILFFIISFVSLIIINVQGYTASDAIYKLAYFASSISLLLLILREICQFISSPKKYFSLLANWVDIALILSSIARLFEFWSQNHHFRMLNTIIILLAMWEYFNILGYLPSVSLHTKIFRKVFMTYFKTLAFYSVMVIGFALSFYTLQGNKFTRDLKDYSGKQLNNKMIEIPSNRSRSDRFDNFYTVGHSIVKSFVMMVGELNASNIQMEGYTYSALFLLFLFSVTIVLYNLLNGLAVSDTHEIKIDAKLFDLQERVLTMHQFEESIFRGFLGGNFPTIGKYRSAKKNGKIIFQMKNNATNFKLNEDIFNDMRTVLLKKREERAANRERRLKEKTYEKLSCDIIKIKEAINGIQNRS